MPRVVRNYRHRDFSYLLIPKQEIAVSPAEEPLSRDIIPAEKRRRDSLMSNRRMRYVISCCGKVHDRDCVHVEQIPDRDFAMAEEFPESGAFCKACYRMALIRKGTPWDLTKYTAPAEAIFSRSGAGNRALEQLFLMHNAKIERVERDCVYLKVREDRWIVQAAEGNCYLYHNNYHLLDDHQRHFIDGFHLQVDRTITFHNAVLTMCQYSWGDHLRVLEEKRKAQHREALAVVSNYGFVVKWSLFYRYFRIVDVYDYLLNRQCAKQLPFRIMKQDKLQPPYSLLLCRIPRWRISVLSDLTKAVKRYAVKRECNDYATICAQWLPEGTA